MPKYKRTVKKKMKPLVFWKLIVLVHQTSQCDAERTNLAHNNFTHTDFFDLNYDSRREKRDDYEHHTTTVLKKIRWDNFRYLIDFDLGNPPQHITAVLSLKYRGIYIVSDTQTAMSIPDLFAKLWKAKPRDGVLQPTKSHTYRIYTTQYFTTYSKFYGAIWSSWAQDDIYIGVTVLEKGKFLVMHDSNDYSMIGLGLSSITSDHVSDEYDKEEAVNIFKQMKKQGWATKSAFSIWIGSESSSASGAILFNAVNYRYALSDLYIFPLISVKNKKGYYIKLEGINVVGLDGSTTEAVKLSVPIEIDFEQPYTTFPEEIVKVFYHQYYMGPTSIFKVSCENEFKKGSLGLVFSGVHYVFPYRDILPDCRIGQNQTDPAFHPGKNFVLGANFISTLFIVFDLDNREIGMAIANTEVEPALVDNEPFLSTISGIRAPRYSSSEVENIYSVVGTYYSTVSSAATVMMTKVFSYDWATSNPTCTFSMRNLC